ncbi:DNA-binding transcriptional ArsR family regulator [Amorphus suaedae]
MVETLAGALMRPGWSSRLDGTRRTCNDQVLQVTFKKCKFKSMNVSDMIPAAGRAADLMRSLSHPQRLLVLCALGREEKSVAQLREELGLAQVPMSQQLMRLRSDGLVEARREGTAQLYRITQPEVLTVVEALHAAFCPVPQDAAD